MEAKVQENREVLLSKVCIGTLISITFTVWLDRGVRIPFFSLSLFNSIIDDPILSSVTNTTHDGWGWACFDALPVDKTTQKHLPELVSTPFDFSKHEEAICLSSSSCSSIWHSQSGEHAHQNHVNMARILDPQ